MKPPSAIEQLTHDLGISQAQLTKLLTEDRFKNPADLVKALQKDWLETRDTPRLLAKSLGYASSSSGAIRVIQRHDQGGADDAGEAVDELSQARFDAEAVVKKRMAAQEVVLAAEAVREALRERMEQSPEFQKLAGRSLYRITAELDRVVKNAKRRAA